MTIDRDLVFKIRKAIGARNCLMLSDKEKVIALEMILELLSAKEKRDINLKIHLTSIGR